MDPEDVKVLDRLARWHGSRAEAVRFLLREIGAPYVELRADIVKLREELVA